MGNVNANPTNQLDPRGQGGQGGQGISPLGSLGGGGIRQNPDGSFTNPNGSVDWNVGYGPQRNWNGEDQRTGQAPIGQAPPDADSVAERGTPQWRQAVATRQAWMQQNRAAGRTLADLGLSPTRGGGLAAYQQFSGMPRGVAGSEGVGTTPVPGMQPTLQPGTRPMASIGGGGVMEQPQTAQKRNKPTNPQGIRDTFNPSQAFPIPGSPVLGSGFMNKGMGSLGGVNQVNQNPMKTATLNTNRVF